MPGDQFANLMLPSWRSCLNWPFATLREIGFGGLYRDLRWHVASNLLSNLVDYGLALCPTVLQIKISDKTRRRIAAGCAVVPQMYCQVDMRAIRLFFLLAFALIYIFVCHCLLQVEIRVKHFWR